MHINERKKKIEEEKGGVSSDLGANFRVKVILFKSGSEVFEGEGNAFHGSSAAPLIGFIEEFLQLLPLFALCIGYCH